MSTQAPAAGVPGRAVGVRPWRRPVAVVLGLACLAGLVRIATGALAPAPTVAGALAVGTAVVVVYGALLAWAIRGLDRWRTLRRGPVLAALGWGGLVAIALAGFGNGRVAALLDHLAGARAAGPLTPVLSAPVVEETLKVLGVLVAVVVAGRRPSGPMETMLLGAVSGLGFQLVENVRYLQDGALYHPISDGAGVLAQLMSRLLPGLDGHWVYTAFSGLAVGVVLCRRTGPNRPGRVRSVALPVLLILLAAGSHLLNNLLGVLGASVVGAAAQLILSVVLFAPAYRFAALEQWRRAVAVLDTEPSTVCGEDEQIDLRTRRTARAARRAVRRANGRPGAQARLHRQRAQIELATAALQGSPTDPIRGRLRDAGAPPDVVRA